MTDYPGNADMHEHYPNMEDCVVCWPKTMTVSGNRITVTRLDEQGNPVGEGLLTDGFVSLNIHPNPEDDILIEGWDKIRNTYTLDMCLSEVDPNLIAILTGQAPLPPYEVWGSPRLYRWLPRFIKRRLKSRWIRRAYGG